MTRNLSRSNSVVYVSVQGELIAGRSDRNEALSSSAPWISRELVGETVMVASLVLDRHRLDARAS